MIIAMQPKTLFLCLGSNRGDRMDYLERALGLISTKIGTITVRSPVYDSDPLGFEDKTTFLNLVAEVHTLLEPEQILILILGIERSLGRDRMTGIGQLPGAKVYRSRTIDIDILFYDDLKLQTAGLVIPHPHLAGRRFVLVPMNAIRPGFVHPVSLRTIRQLLEECPDSSRVELYRQG